MFIYIIVFCLTFLALIWMLSTYDRKVNDVYSQRGQFYWIKYFVFYVLFKLRQRQNRNKANVTGSDAGYGMRSRSTIEEMDQSQELPSSQLLAVDAVYFNGGNSDGYYFVGATARRHHKLTQTLLYIRIPGIGLLEIPSLPDTCLYRDDEMEYAAGGLKISAVKPMKEWNLKYTGQMRLIKSKQEVKMVDVSFDLTWLATSKLFDFDTDLDIYSMCESMAREQWTREFFDTLKKAHQTHYEQFGELKGLVNIDGCGEKELKVQGVRDHSYGNIRDWSDLHRYAIQYMSLEDGTSVCVGNICMPKTMSRLIIGYVFHPDGQMETVSSTDIELHKVGEDGNDPTDWEFSFVAGSKTYNVKCHMVDKATFYMGYQWEGKLYERMCTYDINGVKGWGISEWDYHNLTGRPAKYKKEHEP